MITAAWYLATFLNNNGNWDKKITRAETESACLQQARKTWKNYWLTGQKDNTKLNVLCYSDSGKEQYWIKCTELDSCTLK